MRNLCKYEWNENFKNKPGNQPTRAHSIMTSTFLVVFWKKKIEHIIYTPLSHARLCLNSKTPPPSVCTSLLNDPQLYLSQKLFSLQKMIKRTVSHHLSTFREILVMMKLMKFCHTICLNFTKISRNSRKTGNRFLWIRENF